MINVSQVKIVDGRLFTNPASINKDSIVSIIEDLRMSRMISEIKGSEVSVSRITLSSGPLAEIYVLGLPPGIVDQPSEPNRRLILG